MLTLDLRVNSMQLTFPQWFKLVRQRAGVSQRAIADALGVSVQTVGNWEGERSVPTLNPEQMEKLCALLGVSLETLARGYRGEVQIED